MSGSSRPGVRPLLGLVIDGVGSSAASGASGVAQFVDTVQRAEALGLDLVLLDDALERALDGTARISAIDALAFVARRSSGIGLVSTTRSHYREPFHVAKEVATLDFISGGRAGLVVDATRTDAADAHFPAAAALDDDALAEEASEFALVVEELWDSWEDAAEIRELSTGRYVDNTKIHHIDHAGRYFTVKGPLITPRPPQGNPPLFVGGLLRADPARRLDRVPVHSGAEAVELVRAGGSASTAVLLLDPPPHLVPEVLDALERASLPLPGASAPRGTTLLDRLALPRPLSRYAPAP